MSRKELLLIAVIRRTCLTVTKYYVIAIQDMELAPSAKFTKATSHTHTQGANYNKQGECSDVHYLHCSARSSTQF
jgi:hypothetical protein